MMIGEGEATGRIGTFNQFSSYYFYAQNLSVCQAALTGKLTNQPDDLE